MKKQWIYIALIVMLVVGYQFTEDYFIQGENEFIEAFSTTAFELKQCQISIWGTYNESYMNYDEKVDVLEEMAKALGIVPQYDISKTYEGTLKEVRLIKESKYADSIIKFVTMENNLEEDVYVAENYIIMDLILYKDMDSILHYKKQIEEIFKARDMKPHITINISGEKTGQLTDEEKDIVIKNLFRSIGAKKKESFVTDNIYSVYGYSSLIDEYIISHNKKVNIDVAFTYNKEEDKTNLYLATPIITIDY